jgi:hypothetical protein
MSQRFVSQSSSAQKEDSLNPNLDFSQITQTSPRGVGVSPQRFRDEYCRWHQHPPKEGEGKLLYMSQKTSHWELASKNQNIQFWKLKYTEFEN